MKNKSLVDLFTRMNLFDMNFWQKGRASKQRDNIKLIIDKIKTMASKMPDKNFYRKNKKLIKELHISLPSFLKEMEDKRKEKDVIPNEFLSDDESKEEIREFKAPKPKLSKKPSLVKSNETNDEHEYVNLADRIDILSIGDVRQSNDLAQ